MKIDITTRKLYFGFPVILIGYKDKKWGYNVTAGSSSYSLGRTITIGLVTENNAAKNIKEYKEFTINIPYRDILEKVEVAGFNSGEDKLEIADISYSMAKHIDAPILDECVLSLECRVASIIEYEGYANIIGSIERRVISKELVDANGNLKYDEFNPVYFLGDDKKRKYRFFSDESKELGDYIKGK